nr:cation transporting ATPase C-terminal domain-containing protein [Candidatus Dependentiae bacterium]
GNSFSIVIASLFIDFLPLLPLQILLINVLCDLPMITIASDTVDLDELKHPQTYNLKNLMSTASFLALTSSFFDFLTMALFYHKGPSVLRTNWFIESILSELTLIYSVRTKGVFYKAHRPSGLLLSTSALAAVITVFLPLTTWGQSVFGFIAPHWQDLAIIGAIGVSYFFTTEVVKLLYYRYKKAHRIKL